MPTPKWELLAAIGSQGAQGPGRIPVGSASLPGLPVDGDSNTGLWSYAADTFNISTAGINRFQVGAAGNVLIGPEGTAFGTSAAGAFGIYDGTAPSTSPADMIQMWSHSGDLRVRNEAGVVSQLSGFQNMYPGGRLSLRTGFAQADIEVTGASAQTIYYQPFTHSGIHLWDGTIWRLFQFTFDNISLSLSGLTTTFPYDVYLYNNAGTPTLEVAQWASSSAFTANGFIHGIRCKGGDVTRRYVGTIQMQATGQCEDSYSRRFVWNFYNRVRNVMRKAESTATWSYTTASFRSMNNSTANRIELVSGDYFSLLDIECFGTTTGGTAMRSAGIGLDSTSANTQHQTHGWNQAGQGPIKARAQFYLIGYHFVQALEFGGASASFQGSGTSGASAGLLGIWEY